MNEKQRQADREKARERMRQARAGGRTKADKAYQFALHELRRQHPEEFLRLQMAFLYMLEQK